MCLYSVLAARTGTWTDSCRHLIADNLGWFTESSDEPRTIEEIVRAKGGRIQTGTVYADGKGGETTEIDVEEK